uniref:Uncharacterized protein n=1 Tax=Anopheles culicifacies TaxID=139723 RepID=A0A182MVC1_9DIPT
MHSTYPYFSYQEIWILDGVVRSPLAPHTVRPDRNVSFASAIPPPATSEDVVLARNASAQDDDDDGAASASTHACQLDIAGAADDRREGPLEPKPSFRYKYRKQAPIYLGPDRRQYANPISYLGGPRYDLAKRGSVASSQGDSITSLNSIMSLD